MASLHSEWHALAIALQNDSYKEKEFENQFYTRLIQVLLDKESLIGDVACAYKDALLASPDVPSARLSSKDERLEKSSVLSAFGLNVKRGYVSLIDNPFNDELHQNLLDPEAIYKLEERRHIKKFRLDPVLALKLGAAGYEFYQGAGQRAAVRLALTTPSNSTLILGLPTGVGKTLITYAFSGFTPRNGLTLIIVPTIGLALDQSKRAKEHQSKLGEDHGGVYHWHGEQNEIEKSDIKIRIREGRQKLLFCSPESATTSLLPVLFEAAKSGRLNGVIIDEAHMVESWGLDFRPFFQIFAALLRKLRSLNSNGTKCILMSATLPDYTVNILKGLFSQEGINLVEAYGNFLRPEPQYSVKCVAENCHMSEVLESIKSLPKPLIVYTTKPTHASEIEKNIRNRLLMARVRTFTGLTGASERGRVLNLWNDGKLDIVVGTSAFGLGMNKGDVRSVLHASFPENIDRYYQEIGRGGRDGKACIAHLIYHPGQYNQARRQNTKRLITLEIGYDRWETMWSRGKEAPDGKRLLNLSSLRRSLRRGSNSNLEWNWRTLLLMQRAELIKIEIDEPSPPLRVENQSDEDYLLSLNAYYDEYYNSVVVDPLVDSHLKKKTWESVLGDERIKAHKEQREGYELVRKWAESSSKVKLCDELSRFYKNIGIQPEYTCGGCPACRENGRKSAFSPTIGTNFNAGIIIDQKEWPRSLSNYPLHIKIYYDSPGTEKVGQLLRRWRPWISKLIESGTISAIRADQETLTTLSQVLSRNLERFWVGLRNDEKQQYNWRELVIVTSTDLEVPNLGWADFPRILVAPRELKHPEHYNCQWWERDNQAIEMSSFLRELNYVIN